MRIRKIDFKPPSTYNFVSTGNTDTENMLVEGPFTIGVSDNYEMTVRVLHFPGNQMKDIAVQ